MAHMIVKKVGKKESLITDETKEYPIIDGTVECSTNTTQEEDLANSSGHDTIPYAAPRGCIWIRSSRTQKYELDCDDKK